VTEQRLSPWRIRPRFCLGLVIVLVGLAAIGAIFFYVAWRNQEDRVNAASCTNHFCLICNRFVRAADAHPDFVLPATPDTRMALSVVIPLSGDNDIPGWWVSGSASACPESFQRDRSIGYVYIGDGLRLGDVVEKNILIIFCPAENHRRTVEHCHAWNRAEWIYVHSNAEMIEEIRKAISRGESGEVPYSPRAMTVLREELAKRLKR